jgi:hypothetical protein
MESNSSKSGHRCSKRAIAGRRWGLTTVLAFSLAMLIWTKLRIVTGVPRAVYADPNLAPTPGQVDAGQTSTPGQGQRTPPELQPSSTAKTTSPED